MDISRVKCNLNHKVKLILDRHYVNTEYLLTGCILRRGDTKYYYQAELKDINNNSVIIANLDNIKEIKEEGE